MNRLEFMSYIMDNYGIEYDCPFYEDYDSWVFRHPDNKKWFALLMTIPKSKLGFESNANIDVVNLKCAPEIMDNLWEIRGVFPAYHMSKKHWLTLALDGSCDDETIKFVTNVSYDLTKKKSKKIQNKR